MNNPNLTKVYLLNTPLENDYKHTLWFNSVEDQENYFLSLAKSEFKFEDLMYQRKDHVIKVPKAYDDLLGCNYVMYQNGNGKWYYAFITDIRFNSNGMTEVEIETDVIQTWLKTYTVKPSFVEREHVEDDTVGINTYPEQVELGDYVCNQRVDSTMLGANNCIIVAATIDLSQYESGITEDKYPSLTGTTVGGVYSGISYYEFQNEASLNLCLTNVSKAGKSDGIVSVFMGDSDFYESVEVQGKSYRKIVDNEESDHYEKAFEYTVFPNGGVAYTVTPPTKPTTVNTYKPRNKKLLTYPYCYLYASNNAGGGGIYKYEKFSGTKSEFKFVGNVSPGMSIRLLPLNYDNQAINNEEGLNCGKLPICSWNSDVYTNWLTQNAVNIGIDLASGLINTGVGIGLAATGGGAMMGGMMAVGGVTQIGNTIGQIHQMSFTPPQAKGNINNGDITFSSGWSRISLYDNSIKKEYAQIIDEYFDMFGYKVCRVKTPNSEHRAKYWFTKTIDANIDGAIPTKDLQKIKEAYNNGITFWRKGSDIGNYSTTEGYNKISKVYA